MRKIDIRSLSKELLASEHIEDSKEFAFLLAEASAVHALEYFNIAFDGEHTITFDEKIDFEHSIKVVNTYLAIVEGEKIEGVPKEIVNAAKEYDDHTRDHRGADDGTFDYAGTYVISILEVLRTYFNSF